LATLPLAVPAICARPSVPPNRCPQQVPGDCFGAFSEAILLARNPPAANREHLTHEAVGSTAAQIRRELRILAGGHQPAQRNLASQPLLEARVFLDLGRRVGRVVDEVLGDRVACTLCGASSTPIAWT
jgi:hypothetical protein